MSEHSYRRWVVVDRYRNRLDGYREHPCFVNLELATFETRREARIYAERNYGYLRSRPDLRAEPHGWLAPLVVRATITVAW